MSLTKIVIIALLLIGLVTMSVLALWCIVSDLADWLRGFIGRDL
jgi:hypothetical protein